MKVSKVPPFILRGVAVPPGDQERVDIPVARLTTGEWTHLQVEVVHGAKAGPCLWLSGAVHGDELDGIEIIRQVLERLNPRKLRGTVLAVPVVNVFGFASENRYLPDRRDLNRSFPGGARGSMASRLAKLFMTEVVARCQYGLDFHCGSNGRDNHPQVRGDLQDEDTRQMALAFGAPICIHGQGPEGSLRRASVKAGARVIVYEGGEAQRFTPSAIEAGVEGSLRVMEALGMIQGAAEERAAPPLEVKKTRWTRAARSGICRLWVALGEEVEKGQSLGIISDTMGQESKEVLAGVDGVVIGRRINPLVHLGEALIHIAEI